MEKTTILLVRHGESEGNTLGVFTGHSGYPLTEMGHKQAELTGEYISKNYSVDAVYSSDLPRAFQTAEHIAAKFDLPVVTDCNFREINAGKWENRPFGELVHLFPEDFGIWKNDIANARCTGGESVREVAERMVGALIKVATNHPGQCIVVVAHATPIGTAMVVCADTPSAAPGGRSWGSNCAVNELVFMDGRLRVVSEYYDGHLAGFISELPKDI